MATFGADGFPQVTATWFLWEDGSLRLSLNTSRQKVRNLQRNPAMTAFFTDPSTPYRTLELRGIARIDEDPDYELADKVGARYGNVDLRKMDKPGESRVAITLDIQKVNTYGE